MARIWEGETVAIFGCGPTFTDEQVEQAGRVADRTIAINDACLRAPRAGLLYACDDEWWTHHRGVPAFEGEKWTQSAMAALQYGLRFVPSRDAPGISTDPSYIHQGGNSGFQALNLAVLLGARRVVLYGYDMRRVDGQLHWFGEHPPGVRRDMDFARCIRAFEEAAPQIKKAGVFVLNATPGSALRCFTQP